MKRPWVQSINGKETHLFPDEWALEEYAQANPRVKKLGVVVVKLFRKAPNMDNYHIFGNKSESIYYGDEELITWLGGVSLTTERERILHLANREHGSFEEQYGWRPALLVSDFPSPQEAEPYIMYQMLRLDSELGEL